MYHIPDTQTLNRDAYKSIRPLLEKGGVSAPTLLDWIAEQNPDHPHFVYPDGNELVEISWRQVRDGMSRAAHYFSNRVKSGGQQDGTRPIIAVLAASDSITYWTSIMGIVRANLVAFAISPRNGPDAVAHLLQKVQATALFISCEPALHQVAKKAIDLISRSEDHSTYVVPPVHPMPIFENLYPPQPDSAFQRFPLVDYDLNSPAFIFHSSGTTAFPKPITWRHHDTILWFRMPWFGDIDLAEERLGLHGLPISHPMGAITVCYIASTGGTAAVFKPQAPAMVPNSDNTIEVAALTQSTILCSVPSMLEQYSRDPKKVEALKQFKGAAFGGGPLSNEVGDLLADSGLALFNGYGCTEAGGISQFFPANPGKDWAYFQIAPAIPHDFIPRDDGTYEFVVFEDEKLQYQPMVYNFEHNGRKGYATGDLMIPHPTKKGFWTTYGRADEQIMLSTGEKTNPIPLEKIINEDPHVGTAVMFGRGRFQNGVLIEPEPEFAFDSSNVRKLEEFRNLIWPTVERMNAYAPQHSRLFKEMILVASPSKPFTFTGKGSVRRHAIIKEYDAEIQVCYDAVENLAEGNTTVLEGLNEGQVLDFVRQVVAGILTQKVSDDDDLFQFGCDSLQATWIRIGILKALRAINPSIVRSVSPNIVYDAPSISRLAATLSSIVKASHEPELDGVSSRVHELESKINQFTRDFPPRPSFLRERPEGGDVVLLTGTTGGFGSNILVQLLNDSTVTKVYAFNRTKTNALGMQKEALRTRGLPESVLSSPKFELLEGDLSQTNFGLDRNKYAKLRDSVTHVIHNAWPVDFKLSLISYEKHVQGVRNLVDFALASPYSDPPRLLFVSSVGVFRNPTSREIAPEAPIRDPSVVVGQGYSESKWLSEQILAAATYVTGLPSVVVRLGQLSGNPNGHWNEKEWFPAIVKSAVSVECLPDVPGVAPVSWLPTYDAATALIEMRNSEEPILHLVNPKPLPWRMFLEPIAKELGVPLVPWKLWLSRLENSLTDNSFSEMEHMQHNPALRLLDMWRHADLGEDIEPPGIVRLDTSKARKVAPSLERVPMEPEELARKWVAAWRETGFLPGIQTNGIGPVVNGVNGHA
ncbi:unnamed protein product [Somion occarium]|uniref:Polyketide synthase-like phosphopantetheine-binding domain-containing protein n=1 Tax=Somion occarium TaxID=3059160 RepID=A0ABP1DPR6_9APHY